MRVIDEQDEGKVVLPTTASITKNSIACKFRDEQYNEGNESFQALAKEIYCEAFYREKMVFRVGEKRRWGSAGVCEFENTVGGKSEIGYIKHVN